VPWQHILASEVRAGMTAVAGATDYSRLKPSRRQAVTPVVLASLVQPAVTVDVVVDTSGSMDDAALRTVLSETEGIVRSAGAAVRLYACDAEVHGGVQRVRHAAEAKLCGGGGTDMMKGIRFAAAQRPRADILVVLTDGYTWGGWSAERPSFTRVIIALVGTGHAGLKSLPAWARGLEIRGQEGREP
jgi:predicted metal-dependent peptidase